MADKSANVFQLGLLLLQALAIMFVLYGEGCNIMPRYGESKEFKRSMISPSDVPPAEVRRVLSENVSTPETHEFIQVTDVVHMLRRKVIMTCVNRGFTPLLVNLLYSIQRLGIQHLPQILIICEDKDAYLELTKVMGNFSMKMILTLTNLNESVSEATSYKTDDYKSLVQKRVSYIEVLLQNGVDVFYIDSDIVLVADPFPYFKGNFDIFIQNEQDKKVDLCTGFFYIRANPRTIELAEGWKERLPYDPSGNQRQFNLVVRQMQKKTRGDRLRVKVLPTAKFQSGRVFIISDVPWDQRDPQPVQIHANFLVGRDSKVDMLKNNNLWFVE